MPAVLPQRWKMLAGRYSALLTISSISANLSRQLRTGTGLPPISSTEQQTFQPFQTTGIWNKITEISLTKSGWKLGEQQAAIPLALVVRLDIGSSQEITSEPATLYLTHLGFPAAWNVPATLTLTRRPGYDRGYLVQNVVHLDSNTWTLPDAQVHIAQGWNGRATLNLWTSQSGRTAADGLNFKPDHGASVAWIALDTTP